MRFAARDPGGANPLVALASALRERAPDLRCDAWALPRAAGRLGSTGMALRVFEDPGGVDILERAWTERPADALVTATSHYAPFEAALWDIAGRRGVPSLAVLDQAGNAGRRFAHGRPAFVGAVDGPHAAELERAGFAPDQVLVLGYPWLASLLRQGSGTQDDVPAAPGRETRVLFVSEPIGGDVAAGYGDDPGFDEADAFAVLHGAACDVAAGDRPVSLRVRPHPYEETSRWESRVRALPPVPGVTVSVSPPAADAIASVRWAHLVVGIASMLLVEAVALGRPIVSVQPDLAIADRFPGSRLGLARPYTDADGARAALRQLISDAPARAARPRAQRAPLATVDVDAGSALLGWLRRAPSLAR